jgi:hypothetical protein
MSLCDEFIESVPESEKQDATRFILTFQECFHILQKKAIKTKSERRF